MKKNAVFTGIVMILLIGCAVLIHNANRKDPSQLVLTEHEWIQLEVKAIDHEKKCLKILFSNQTNETIWYYPYEWAMERKAKDAWYTMEKQNEDQRMEGPAIEAQPLEIGETKEMTFNWGEVYGEIPPGTYRVYFWILEEGDHKSYIGAEFTLDRM